MFFTEVSGDKVNKKSLCESCAQEYQNNTPNLPPFDQLFGEVLEELESNEAFEYSEEEAVVSETSVVCPECDFTLQDYKATGRFGCSTCYPTFKHILLPKLTEIHKGSSHEGRVNHRVLDRVNHAEIIEELTRELERAIEAEDYERAGELRDQIKEASKQASEQQ